MSRTYTNKELIQGCIRKNRVHQEALYRKFCPQMIQLGYRFTRNQELIIEWVNNGFLKVFFNIENLGGQDGERLGGWVRTVVYRCIIDGVRKEKKYWNNILVDDSKLNGSVAYQQHSFAYSDLLDLIDTLPTRSKAVFELYALQGYTHEEIGRELDISEGTSKWHLHQARKDIQAIIEKRRKKEYYG